MPADQSPFQPARPLQSPPAFRATFWSLAPMLALAAMWGLSIPVTKLALQSLPPLTLTAARFAIALPFLFFMVLGKPIPWQSMLPLAGSGILGIGLGQLAQTFGITGTSASAATILSATIPLFVVLFAALRLKQHVTGAQKLGLLAAFLGIGCVALGQGDAASSSSSTLLGMVLILVSALSIAFYYVWSVELTQSLGTPIVAAWTTLFGFLALLPFSLWEATHQAIAPSTLGLGCALYLGLVVSVAGLYLWLHILRTVPAGIAAAVQYLQPVIGIAAAAIVFSDRLGLLFGLGVALILFGLALAATNSRKAN